MAALDQMFIPNNIDATTLSMIVTQMFSERDVQMLNYVFTLFEKYSKSSHNCGGGAKMKMVGYFLKYMKKLRLHKADYGFHVSQTYRQEAQDGGHEVWLIGGGESFLPEEIRFRLDSNQFGGYQTNLLEIRVRTQGLSEAVSEMFYKRDKIVWKTEDLAEVLRKMGIVLKQNPIVEMEIEIKVKDVIVFQKILTKDMFSNPKKDTLSDLVGSLQVGQSKQHWVGLVSLGTQVNRFRSYHFSIISSRNVLSDL